MRKKVVTLLLILTLCLTLVLFPSCKKKTQEGTLSARMEGARLVWDAYDGAASYTVKCTLMDRSGYLITVKENSYVSPYTTPGDYAYTVFAKDANDAVIARSETVVYHLGTGRSEDVVLIGSAEDLASVSESYTLQFGTNKVDAPIYYRLTSDIDLTGKSFSPIGNSGNPFRGVFDGAGHTIRGLSITKCNTDGNVGLFGFVKNAVVKNLTLADASILFDKDSDTSKGELNCGLLIGHSVASHVENCHVTGSADILTKVITTDNSILSAGGIIGRAESGVVTRVSFAGDIKAQYGRSYAGGICGFALGDSPNFMLLNARSVAHISAVGTSYNVSTGAIYAYARAGVVIGNLSHAGRLASLLAIGSAAASSTKDGTPVGNLTSGVFGRTKSDSNVSSIPMYNVFYSSDIPKVVGSVSSLGSYAKYVYPLTEEEMKDKEHYLVGENRYGLSFDEYWDIQEGSIPTLKTKVAEEEQPAMTVTFRSEVNDHKFSYDVNMKDAFIPTYFDLGLETTVHALGYSLNDVINDMGIGITSLYTDAEIAKGISVKISAEGKEDLIVTVTQSSIRLYLEYGVHSVYEAAPDILGGYKIIDTASLKTYDYTNQNHITITFLPA